MQVPRILVSIIDWVESCCWELAAHLKVHPLVALAVLFVAEHALGVWGLLVAVPMAVFCSEYLIKRTPMCASTVEKSAATLTS